MDTIRVSARNNPLDIYRAASPRVWDIRKTIVSVKPDWAAREAACEATLEIVPVYEAKDTLVLDAKDMEIYSVLNPRLPLIYRYDSNSLQVYVRNHDFGTEAAKNPLILKIRYKAKPYSKRTGGSAAIKEDRGLYFINTDGATPGKPRQIWTQGETESNSNWLPTIDKPNQRTKITLMLTVPDTMQSLGNGMLVSSKKTAPGFREDIWQSDSAIQAYAIMFAIGRFDKTAEKWKSPSGKELEVAYYTEPEYKPFAKGMFRHTPEMMSLFSRVTGVPYPWEKYSQIVVRDFVSGAMENTSASLFGEFHNQNNRQLIDAMPDDIVSHELFHQWFGDYATMESWSNLTVSESFATYGEVLWRLHKYGRNSADELAYEDKQRYLNAAQRLDPPLVRFHYRDKEEMFDRVSYQKGGAILRYIHSQIGDSAFYRAMKIYLTENALKSTEATHWRLALEKATGKDWTQFFNEWYYRGGHPELVATHIYDDAAQKLTIRIRQQNRPDSAKLYTMPLSFVWQDTLVKTDIVTGSETQMIVSADTTYVLSKRQQDFVFPYRDGGRQRPIVRIDPWHYLPGIIEERKPLRLWREQMNTGAYGATRAAINAALKQQGEPEAVPIYLDALRSGPEIKLHALNMLSTVTNVKWQEALKDEVKFLLRTETKSKPLAAAYRVAGVWDLRSERKRMEEAVWDSSYFVAGAALTALTRIDKDTAYMLAKRIVPTQPRSALADAVWQIIGKHGERQDFGLLERYSTGTYGGERRRMMERLSYFASETTDDTLYRRSIERITQEARAELEPGARASVATLIIRLRRYYDLEAQKKGRNAGIAERRGKWAKEQEAILIEGEKDEAVKERLEQVARGAAE